MTDQFNAPYKTMGFCATCERYTEHVCAKCRDTEAALGASHDTAMLPRVDLALVKEVQDLRAERDALEKNVARLHVRLANISDFTFNGLNEPGSALKWLDEIEKTLNGDYDEGGRE